jgi:hypothetical protein
LLAPAATGADCGNPQPGCTPTKFSSNPRTSPVAFVDLGFLAYYATCLLATDATKAHEGQEFTAGRFGRYTIARIRPDRMACAWRWGLSTFTT